MKFTFFALIIFSSLYGQAQQKKNEDKFFVFDSEWKTTDVKKGVYLLRVRQISDSNWEWLYYNMFGPRIKLERFKDIKATAKNGTCIYYYPDGVADSTGEFLNGLQNDKWYFLNHDGQLIRKKTYDNGVLLSDSSFIPQKKDPSKKVELQPGEIESEYPGGLQAWARFLNKNLHYPERALNSVIQGEVRILFVVDTEGNFINPEIYKSVEYSLDEETLRILQKSGKWVPAEKDQKKVKSYKMQPIIFKLK